MRISDGSSDVCSSDLTAMRYKQLGDTGMFVSEICLGTMTFGNSNSMWGSIAGLEQHEVNQIMERALAAGINFIDTADVYSIGQSEKLLGQSLKDLGIHRKDEIGSASCGKECVSTCRSRVW